MGDITDQMEEMYGLYEDYDYVYRPRRKKRKKFQPSEPYTWKDGNDVIHNMHDMEVSHIKNTIRFLEGMETYPEKLEELKEVLFEKTRHVAPSNYDSPPRPTRRYTHKKSTIFGNGNNDDLDDEIPF